MSHGLKQHQAKPLFENKLTNLLSSAVAGTATFFATGPIFQNTKDFIRDYVELTYSYNLVGVSTVLYFGLIAIIMFCISTIIIQTMVHIIRSKSFIKFIR